MKCSVIVPVFNEVNTIAEIINRIKAVNLDKEIIIVDDKSSDGTSDILRDKFSFDKDIRIIYHDKNHGKGYAIRTALKHVSGDVVIMQDADLEYDPQDYSKLIAPINDGRASVVYGSRFMHLKKLPYLWCWLKNKLKGRGCPVGHLYLSNFFGIQLLNMLARLLYGIKITDEATCYKVFKTEVLKSLKLESVGFEFCPEVTAKISKAGYKIFEVSISYSPRSTEHGKKVSWRDGLIAIKTLLKYRIID